MKERVSVFERVPAWKSRYKRAVLWLYERDWITRRFAQRLIDVANARLA